MKNNNYIISSLILLLSVGLFISLLSGNKKVDHSFDTYEILSELKATNQKIDNCIQDVGPKNYDEVNNYIANGNKILQYIQKMIIDDNIDDKDFLNSFEKIQDNFNIKIELVQQCKTSNSLVNNSYKNLLQLYNILKYQVYAEDRAILDDAVLNILTINKQTQQQKLQQITTNKYKDNSNIQLLYSNITVYQINFLKIQKIQKYIKKQNLIESISNFIKFYSNYNHQILKNTKIIIFIFVIALLFTLVLNYIINKRLTKKTKELEASIITIDENVIMSQTDLKGVITNASKAFCKISGYSKKELIGKQHNYVRHPDMEKEAFKNLWATIKKDKIWRGEVKNLTKDGGFYWVNAVVAPLYSDGVKIGYTSVRDNITDKKTIVELNSSLEDKIKQEVEKNRKQDQQLLQQSRLAQMGEMISMIAHQWRQPLAAISSTSSGINLKAKLNKLDKDTAIELSSKISQYSQHLSSTIDDFRDFFKSNKEKRETTYDELVKSVLNIVEISILNQNINLVKKLNSKDTLTTYPNEIKQVILNLIKNAEDVLLEKGIENPIITIETQSSTLTISDNGGGIPEDIIDKVFDPYFSTKTKKDGTGLGLYMSKTIIEEHCGGKLIVSNDKDGAVFTIELEVNNK